MFMDTAQTLLTIAALIPANILGVYIFIKDRAEKEPVWLLLILLVFGAIISLPVVYIGGFFEALINGFFGLFASTTADGQLVLGFPVYEIYLAAKYFIGVALVEEGLKWIVMFFFTHKSKHFNSLFDGIVYAVFVSLGFAAFENVLYVWSGGWTVALLRALTSVPAHMFFGVAMGWFYTWWNVERKATEKEKALMQKHRGKGIFGKRAGFILNGSLAASLFVPITMHAFYDIFCSYGTITAMILFGILVLGMYFYCFKIIRDLSKVDALHKNYVVGLIIKKHPACILDKDVVDDLNEMLAN